MPQIIDLVLEADELFTCNGELSPWVLLSLVCLNILAIGMENILPILSGLFLGSGLTYHASVIASAIIFTPWYLNALIYWATLLLNSSLDLITHIEAFLQGDTIDPARATLILEYLTEYLRTHTFVFEVLNRLCIFLEELNFPEVQQLLQLVEDLRDSGNRLYSLYRNLEGILGVGASVLPVQDWEC